MQTQTPPDAVTSAAMPPELGARYFLVRSCDPTLKPVVFRTLKELCARIHRERGDDTLQTLDQEFRFLDEELGREAVTVMAVDVGGRARLIGHAYLGGRDAHVLQAALEAQVPRHLTWARAH